MYDRRSVFLFGGLGFIGHRLAISLSDLFDVHVIDNAYCVDDPDPEITRRFELLQVKGIKVHRKNIFDKDAIVSLVNNYSIDTVFHLAGASSVKSTYSSDGFEEVLGITNTLLSALSSARIKRFVYFSSSMIYGNFLHSSINEEHEKKPVDRYGALKYASEVLVNGWAKERNIISVILRPTAVYGANDIKQRIVAKFLKQADSGDDLTISGNGENRLDFTYVDDVVAASKAAADYPYSDEFNISFGHSRSLNELATLIAQIHPRIQLAHDFEAGHPIAKRGSLNSDKAIRLLDYDPKFSLEHGLTALLLEEGSDRMSIPNFAGGQQQNIPLGKADLLSSDLCTLNTTLQTGWYTSGPANEIFEQKFLEYQEQTDWRALSVNSCASALILALRAHNITGGVLVPAFTFSATANSVVIAGATPQFVDIEPRYLGLDPEALERSITADSQAIIVVHLAGVICEIEAIVDIAKRHNLVVIEDCAQALAAEYGDQKAGSFGDTSCFSFFPTKMITTGEGGMLVTKNQDIYSKAKMLANHGYGSTTLEREKNLKPWLRQQIEPGFNFRMSSINASLGIAQLERLDDIASTRRRKALTIISALNKVGSIEAFEFDDRYSVYQALNILVPMGCDRDALTIEIRRQGVMASVHYPEVLPETSVFNKYVNPSTMFPVSHNIASSIITLPLFGALTTSQVQRIVDVVGSSVTKQSSVSTKPKIDICEVAST